MSSALMHDQRIARSNHRSEHRPTTTAWIPAQAGMTNPLAHGVLLYLTQRVSSLTMAAEIAVRQTSMAADVRISGIIQRVD